MASCFNFSKRAAALVSALLLVMFFAALPSPAQEPSAQASGMASSPPTTAQRTVDQDYLISPDDLLDVYIVDVAEMSRAYRVGPSGMITLPLIGKPLPASGLTLAQLSEVISTELKAAGLVSTPQVTVSVQQSRAHSVAITGAVKHPQIYPLLTKTTLLDVLSQAEGLADDASNVAIVRRGDIAIHALGLDTHSELKPEEREALLTVTVDTKRVMESSDPNVNIDIYPGDRVTVPRAGIVYVVGAVNKPGGFTMKPSKQGMTVLQAVALAEDLKSTAIGSKSVLLRADAQGPDGRKQIPIDLKKVLAGKAHDVVLQADDILFVPDSPGKKAFRKGLESALQMAGVAIYRF